MRTLIVTILSVVLFHTFGQKFSVFELATTEIR